MFKVLNVMVALLVVTGCSEETEPEANPCVEAVQACFETCPENAAPVYTQRSSCEASCNGTYFACQKKADGF